MATEPRTSTTFTAGLKLALAGTNAKRPTFEDAFPVDRQRHGALQVLVNHRSPEDQLALLEQLTANANAIAIDVIPLATPDALNDAVVTMVEQMPRPLTVVAWNHPFLVDTGLAEALAQIDAQLIQPAAARRSPEAVQRDQLRQASAQASLGITSADYCVAETATLVMRNRPGQPRSTSLLPEIHAAVISLDQIIASPAELFALMDDASTPLARSATNCMTWVSGNSKTGDIEAELVPGVHGPKRLVIFVLTGFAASESKMDIQ